MTIGRRHLLGATAAGLAMPSIAQAQARQLNLAGASFDMREPILREFARRTNITPRPWVNPSTQARIDRVRTAPVDCITTDAPFAAYGNGERLTQPIDVSRIPNWSKMHPLLKDGRATPTSPLGLGANPGRMMYTSDAKTQAIFMPTFFQMDSIGYNTAPRRSRRTTSCPGASCSTRNTAARSRCSASTGWACWTPRWG